MFMYYMQYLLMGILITFFPLKMFILQKYKLFFVCYRFQQIVQPLEERRKKLERVKEVHQFLRNVEDEKLWIQERMPRATSEDYGNSLQSVLLLKV